MRVSVILTTYNSANTIQRTLNSILSQKGIGTAYELELLLVDDASTDNTPHILAENNISFLTNSENSGGPNKGRNVGLKHATGEYICFCDHDDVWEPNKIIRQLEYTDQGTIISTGYKIIYNGIGKEDIRCIKGLYPRVYNGNVTFLNKLAKYKGGQAAYLSTIMIHKSLKNVLFEERFGMIDFDWLLRLFKGQRSVELPDCLIHRYVDGTNLSLNPLYRMNDYYYSLYALELYEKEYPSIVAKARKRINGSRGRYFYLMSDMKSARRYFRRSSIDLKMLSYYLTSYAGSKFVKRNFTIFG